MELLITLCLASTLLVIICLFVADSFQNKEGFTPSRDQIASYKIAEKARAARNNKYTSYNFK